MTIIKPKITIATHRDRWSRRIGLGQKQSIKICRIILHPQKQYKNSDIGRHFVSGANKEPTTTQSYSGQQGGSCTKKIQIYVQWGEVSAPFLTFASCFIRIWEKIVSLS